MTLHPKTAKEALNTTIPQVSVLKNEIGETILNALLTLAVSDLVNSFNIGKTMNDEQIVFVVETIKIDYYFIRLDELKYCFNQAKKGRYGQIYDRIDCATICQWVEKYFEERMGVVYELRMEEEKQEADNFTLIGNQILSLKNAKGESFKISSFKDKQEKKEGNAPSKMNTLHQLWFKQFDRIERKTGTNGFVFRYGKMIDCIEYCEYKIEQQKRIKLLRKINL